MDSRPESFLDMKKIKLIKVLFVIALIVNGLVGALWCGFILGQRIPKKDSMESFRITTIGAFRTGFHPGTKVEARVLHVSEGQIDQVDLLTLGRFGKAVNRGTWPVSHVVSYYLITEDLHSGRVRYSLRWNAPHLGPISSGPNREPIPDFEFATIRYSDEPYRRWSDDALDDGKEHVAYVQGDAQPDTELKSLADVVEYTKKNGGSYLLITVKKKTPATK